jgi:hypothetical protein
VSEKIPAEHRAQQRWRDRLQAEKRVMPASTSATSLLAEAQLDVARATQYLDACRQQLKAYQKQHAVLARKYERQRVRARLWWLLLGGALVWIVLH